jgi:hypothetical protein
MSSAFQSSSASVASLGEKLIAMRGEDAARASQDRLEDIARDAERRSLDTSVANAEAARARDFQMQLASMFMTVAQAFAPKKE